MKRSLALQRPLAVIDAKTTGFAPDLDRIVEIAILKIFPNRRSIGFHTRLNPEIPAPAEPTGDHRMKDECVKGEPSFPMIAAKAYDMLEDSDIAGFDISACVLPILQKEFKRAGIEFSLEYRAVVDAMQIFHLKEPRDLATACRFYLSVKHNYPHSALEDARMTLRVLESQLHRYRDLPCDPLGLGDVCAPGNERYVDSGKKFEWRRRQAALAFGAHYGKFLRDIAREDPDYLGWMAETDLPTDTRQIAREALKGKFPKRTKTEKDD